MNVRKCFVDEFSFILNPEKNHVVKLSLRNTEAYVGSFQLFFQSASSGIYDFGHIPVCQSSAKG